MKNKETLNSLYSSKNALVVNLLDSDAQETIARVPGAFIVMNGSHLVKVRALSSKFT